MLELRNLTFEADGKRIVDDISLTFTQHAFTCLLYTSDAADD